MLSDKELEDIGRLACQRCEQAANSVGQLLENEQQACELLINVMNSMMMSCATLMSESCQKPDGNPPTKEECIIHILDMLGLAHGIEKMFADEKNRSKGKLP